MARIAGIDIPREKRVEIALTYIYGIGLTRSKLILSNTGVNPDVRVKDLSDEIEKQGVDKIVERIRNRVGNNPLYLSIDIDVLDPAHAPGTGTPEIAGMTSREMVNVIRGLSGMKIISADVVEVAPAYDHAEVTSLAAATIVYELTNLFAKAKR